MATPDIGRFERRLGREAVPGNRRFPDGRELSWRQIGVKGTLADPQLPFILRWADGQEDMHPSQAAEPQALVSPAPRSQVRITICSRVFTAASEIFARSGKIG